MRWGVEVPLAVRRYDTSRVGVQGTDALPLNLTLDVATDFLPRVYGISEQYPSLPVDGSQSVPEGLTWQADPGLSRADILITQFSAYGSNTPWISWAFMARPSEATSLVVPKLDGRFPGQSALANAEYGYFDDITFIDLSDVEGLEALLEYCALGASCDIEGLDLSYSSCCSSGNRD